MPEITTIEKYWQSVTNSANDGQIEIANILDSLFHRAKMDYVYVLCGKDDYWLFVVADECALEELISVKKGEIVFNDPDCKYLGRDAFGFIKDVFSFYDYTDMSEDHLTFNHDLKGVLDYFEGVFPTHIQDLSR